MAQAPGNFFHGEAEPQPPSSSWPVLSCCTSLAPAAGFVCQLQKRPRLCPPSEGPWCVAVVCRGFRGQGLLGSRRADFLLVCSWVLHSCVLVIPRIEVTTVYQALILCQVSCRGFPPEYFPPLIGLPVLPTLLYFLFFPKLETVFQKPRKGPGKCRHSISTEWINEWVCVRLYAKPVVCLISLKSHNNPMR